MKALYAPDVENIEQPVSRMLLQRNQSIHDARQVSPTNMVLHTSLQLDNHVLACLYRDKYLVKVTHQRANTYRVNVCVNPFRSGGKAQAETLHDFSAGSRDLLCGLRVTVSERSMVVVVLILNGRAIYIKVELPESSNGVLLLEP